MVSETRYNDFFYLSYNNLGLIYYVEENNIDKAVEYIKEAVFSDYPFGQNNYGIINQFKLGNINNAIYNYEKSSKHKFALAEYNLGYIYEKENEIQQSIEHYKKALEYENEQLIFHSKEVYDEKLQISNMFITSFINMKLIYIEEETNIKKHFYNAIFRPLIYLLSQSQENSYSFQLNAEMYQGKYYVTNLNDFLLYIPLSKSQCNDNSSSLMWKSFESENITIKNDIKMDQPKNNIVDGKMIDTSIKTNDIIENENEDDCILHQIEQILTGLNKRKHFCLLINDINDNKTHKIIGFKSLNDDKIRYLEYPKNMKIFYYHWFDFHPTI